VSSLTSTPSTADCTRELHIQVPAAVVAQETETLLRKYQKLARVPGFRRGKVPFSVVRQRFAGELKDDLLERLVPKYFLDEAEKHGLKPVSEPKVSELSMAEGEALHFKATFEVLPEIEISGYEALRPGSVEVEVTAAEIEQALQELREQHAAYAAVENRALQEGDYAQVAFTGTPRQAPGKPIRVDDVLVEIGGANTVPAFTENLRGLRPGDERTFEVIYPEDFADERLAGSAFTYAVTVKGIKSKSLPELNDEFARQVGEWENLGALRQRVRDGIKIEKERAAERQAKDRIIESLVQRHAFPLPEALVERQIGLRLARGLRALAAQGMRAEDLQKMDMTRLRAAQREPAARDVRVALILDRIADLENLELSDAEVNRELEAMARQARQTVEELRTRLTREGTLARLRQRLRNEKTLDFLYHRSA